MCMESGPSPSASMCACFKRDMLDYYHWFVPGSHGMPVKPGAKVMGDFSASYFASPCAATTIKKHYPGVKLMIILRHPFDRARSRYTEQVHFWKKLARDGTAYLTDIVHDRLELTKPHDFNGVIDEKLPQLEKCLAKAGEDHHQQIKCTYVSNILGWSIYSTPLRVWFDAFPVDRFLTLYTDELKEEPRRVMRLVEKHLGLPSYSRYKGMGQRMNSASCGYGWTTQCNEQEQDARKDKKSRSAKSVQERRLLKFYEAEIKALRQMANGGLIRAPPESWG